MPIGLAEVMRLRKGEKKNALCPRSSEMTRMNPRQGDDCRLEEEKRSGIGETKRRRRVRFPRYVTISSSLFEPVVLKLRQLANAPRCVKCFLGSLRALGTQWRCGVYTAVRNRRV